MNSPTLHLVPIKNSYARWENILEKIFEKSDSETIVYLARIKHYICMIKDCEIKII